MRKTARHRIFTMSIHPNRFHLVFGFVCLLSHSLQVHCSGSSEIALHFLHSERGEKLASLREKLDIDQVKDLLMAIENSPSNEFILPERAAEMVKVSEVETNPCTDKTFDALSRLTDAYSAFPNLFNYLDHYRLEQFKKCPVYIERGKLGYTYRLSKEDLIKLGANEPAPVPAQPQAQPQPAVQVPKTVSDLDAKPRAAETGAVRPHSGTNGSNYRRSRLIPRCFHA